MRAGRRTVSNFATRRMSARSSAAPPKLCPTPQVRMMDGCAGGDSNASATSSTTKLSLVQHIGGRPSRRLVIIIRGAPQTALQGNTWCVRPPAARVRGRTPLPGVAVTTEVQRPYHDRLTTRSADLVQRVDHCEQTTTERQGTGCGRPTAQGALPGPPPTLHLDSTPLCKTP